MKNLKTKLSYALYTVLACVLLISCNHLEEGIVVGRHYEPTEQNMVIMPLIMSNGKTTTTMMIPYFVTDYEDYVLHIKGVYKGEEVIEQVYVTKDCYERLQNGGTWYKDDSCSFSDDNNTKERRN